MAGKHFVGTDYVDFTNSGYSAPVSRVTFMIDSDTAVTAGDDSGSEMRTDCPFATQEMAEALLAKIRGYRFQMFSAEAARLDPTAELGDAVDINGVYAIISHRADDGSMFQDISAVGEAELEDEYPTEGPVTQVFNLKIAKTRSLITKTASQIRLEVADLTSEMAASFVTELSAITGRVDGLNGQFSEFKNTVDGFTVTDPDGTTRIKGSSIDTGSITVGSITADKLNLTGAITFFDLNESVYRRITDGITEEIAHTLIRDDLVASPTMRGAKIYGGAFYDLDGYTRLTLSKESSVEGMAADFLVGVPDGDPAEQWLFRVSPTTDEYGKAKGAVLDVGHVRIAVTTYDENSQEHLIRLGYYMPYYGHTKFLFYNQSIVDFSNATVTGLRIA